MSIYELVAGDVVLIEPGCMVPADAVLIEGEDIIVDESKYAAERTAVKKKVVTDESIQR